MEQSRRDFLKTLGLGVAVLTTSGTKALAASKQTDSGLTLGEYVDLHDLYCLETPLTIADPVDDCSIGGKDSPIHIYWNDQHPRRDDGQAICAEDVIIDNQRGQLRVREADQKERVLLQWSVPKTRLEREKNNPKDNWLRDETGPHILIGIRQNEEDVEAIHYAPATIPALRNHPLHYRNIYVNDHDFKDDSPLEAAENHGTQMRRLSDLDIILPRPTDGKYHAISERPPVNKNSAAWILWCDDVAHKMAYNILHFDPKIKGYRQEHNLSLLALAMTESAGGEVGDKLGPNPFLVNYAGYGGLFQFYVGEKAAKREALKDAGFANRDSGHWNDTNVDGKTINSATTFLESWQAQCYAQLQWMKKLQQYIEPAYIANKHRPHVKKHPHSLFGYCAAAHLKGPGAAKALLGSGKVSRDGTGTPNSYYAHKFSLLPDDCFFRGQVSIPDRIETLSDQGHPEFEGEVKRSLQLSQDIRKLKPIKAIPRDHTLAPTPSKALQEWMKKNIVKPSGRGF